MQLIAEQAPPLFLFQTTLYAVRSIVKKSLSTCILG
ncbi:hypothetical protein Tsp_13384 [Trichinella spiralis]|nr:hypothetical protein Tsp_13384 [Trichinella spiralis]